MSSGLQQSLQNAVAVVWLAKATSLGVGESLDQVYNATPYILQSCLGLWTLGGVKGIHTYVNMSAALKLSHTVHTYDPLYPSLYMTDTK